MEQLINITDLLLVEMNKSSQIYLARREGEEDDSEDPLGGGEGEPEEEPEEDEDGEV